MDIPALKEAIYKQDLEDIKRVLDSMECLTLDSGQGSLGVKPIFHCLASRGKDNDARINGEKKCELLKLLIQRGVNLNDYDPEWKATPAVLAARRGSLRCLEILVESGADLSIPTDEGDTALTVAADKCHVDCVKYLTAHASSSLLNHRNHYRETALLISAYRGGFLCLQNLVEAGAELDLVDGEGYSALMYALESTIPQASTLLLEKGACVNTASHLGKTPLTCAVSGYVPRLMLYGLDPTTSRRDQHRLHDEIYAGGIAAVRALVLNGFPPLDLISKHFSFYQSKPTPISPLAMAIIFRRPDIAKYLIINRFFTRYDIVRLCYEPRLRRYYRSANESDPTKRECREILEFLSLEPQSLQSLCFITISLVLSQDFGRAVGDTAYGPDSWRSRQSFRERVGLLNIPQVFKNELLHQTSSAAICCRSWCGITLGVKENYTACCCTFCEGYT